MSKEKTRRPKYRHFIDVMLIRNMVHWDAIGYDSVRLFGPVFRRTAHKYGHNVG